MRATHDVALREGFLAGNQVRLVEPLVAPYLGVGSDGPGVAILMPDLSPELIAWERPEHDPVLPETTVDRVLQAVARLHAMPWSDYSPTSRDWDWPWCPVRDRLLLLSPPSAERYRGEGLAVGERFAAGWDAFDRVAPASARSLLEQLSADPSPLLAALGRLPRTGLHGDLKFANVALLGDGRVAFIDWQMMTLAPVSVELGWMLVSNSASLPIGPGEVLVRYRRAAERAALDPMRLAESWHSRDQGPVGPDAERLPDRVATLPARGIEATIGNWDAQVDLTWIVGLLLRGWRKGLDSEAGLVLGSGVSAADDLAWWCRRAVDGASRRL